MSKNRMNLFQQFNNSIDNSFVLHFDKHAAKSNPDIDTSSIVFSIQGKANLKDISHDFSQFIKSEYHISRAANITPDMCNSYIQHCIDIGNSKQTIEQKISSLKKLSEIVNKQYHIHTNFKTDISKFTIPDKTTRKEYSFTKNDMDRILHEKISPKSLNSESYKFLNFNYTGLCALRVNTVEKLLCRDITIIDEKTVKVDILKDKGGRSRTIIIENNEKFANMCRDLKSGKNHNDKIFNITKSAVNKFINRRCNTLKIISSDGNVVKSGNHSLRKLCIQERVNHLVENGMDLHEAAKKICSEFGGHGENRTDLIDTYVYSKT